MKVYIVVGTGDADYGDYLEWNEAVFVSKEAAESYIQAQPELFYLDKDRIYEIERLERFRALTKDEYDELHSIYKRWHGVCRTLPSYRIETWELQE